MADDSQSERLVSALQAQQSALAEIMEAVRATIVNNPAPERPSPSEAMDYMAKAHPVLIDKLIEIYGICDEANTRVVNILQGKA